MVVGKKAKNIQRKFEASKAQFLNLSCIAYFLISISINARDLKFDNY